MKRDGSSNLGRKQYGLPLTERERHICDLTASGLTAPAIAEQLGISHRTVGSHLSNVFGKLGVRNAAQLATKLKNQEVQLLQRRVTELEEVIATLQDEVSALQRN